MCTLNSRNIGAMLKGVLRNCVLRVLAAKAKGIVDNFDRAYSATSAVRMCPKDCAEVLVCDSRAADSSSLRPRCSSMTGV